LDGGDVIPGFEQTGLSARVQPGHSTAEQLHMQGTFLEVEQVQIGDFQFVARGRLERLAEIDHARVVNIKAGNGKLCLRSLRLFLETDYAAIAVELHHAVAFRIAHLVAENARAVFDRERFPEKIEFPVKDVIAENEAGPGIADKL